MRQIFFGLFFIFSSIAYAQICALPIGSCAPAPCSYRESEVAVYNVVLDRLPFEVNAPTDTCPVAQRAYSFNSLLGPGGGSPTQQINCARGIVLGNGYNEQADAQYTCTPGSCASAQASARASFCTGLYASGNPKFQCTCFIDPTVRCQ